MHKSNYFFCLRGICCSRCKCDRFKKLFALRGDSSLERGRGVLRYYAHKQIIAKSHCLTHPSAPVKRATALPAAFLSSQIPGVVWIRKRIIYTGLPGSPNIPACRLKSQVRRFEQHNCAGLPNLLYLLQMLSRYRCRMMHNGLF